MDKTALLKQLVAIPSYSRNEADKADFLQQYMQSLGLEVLRCGNNLWTWATPYQSNKPVLMLNSHIDTVKPNASWTRNPHQPVLENGCLYGLGSNDAHASVVCLLDAFMRLRDTAQAYNLVLAYSCEEEVSGKEGMELLLTQLPPVTFALVGEPTGMQVAVAEKGLMVLDCTAAGVSGHAAREEGVNAIYQALPDIAWFRDYRFSRVSPVLGPVKTSVTMVQAGTQHNVVPDCCKFTVDVRLNECYTHQQLLDEIALNVKCSVQPRSMRLKPSGLDSNHAFVHRCKQLGVGLFGSSTLSDQALMDFASAKCGPGQSARSHTADEYVALSELEAAPDLYVKLLDGLQLD